MWLTVWNPQGKPLYAALPVATFAGVLFGLFQAFYYRYSFNKNKLTRWDDL